MEEALHCCSTRIALVTPPRAIVPMGEPRDRHEGPPSGRADAMFWKPLARSLDYFEQVSTIASFEDDSAK